MKPQTPINSRTRQYNKLPRKVKRKMKIINRPPPIKIPIYIPPTQPKTISQQYNRKFPSPIYKNTPTTFNSEHVLLIEIIHPKTKQSHIKHKTRQESVTKDYRWIHPDFTILEKKRKIIEEVINDNEEFQIHKYNTRLQKRKRKEDYEREWKGEEGKDVKKRKLN